MKIRALLFVLCALAVGTAHAEEGRIPIYEPVDYDGATADFSGRYVLTRDITVDSGSTRVIMFYGTGVETVDLDLNGFHVTHNGTAQEAIYAGNLKSFTLRNGFVTTSSGGGYGLRTKADVCVAEDLIVEAGGLYGVWLQGCRTSVVRRNVIRTLEGTGVWVETLTDRPVKAAKIEDNTVIDVRDYGIFLLTASDAPFKSVTIRGNTIKHNGSTSPYFPYGIKVSNVEGASITENSIANFSLSGIDVYGSSGNAITGNVIRDCREGIRIRATSGSLVADNVLAENTREGIEFTQSATRNVVERNVMMNNGQWGLSFEAGCDYNIYGRNAARGNGGGSCTGGTATCGGTDCCDLGADNTSLGDNLLPGPPPS